MRESKLVLKKRVIHAPRGRELLCKGWQQEAALRMLMNNLDPEVAKDPENLIVYGGTGKAARNWECYDKIVETLKELESDETLFIQSGKPVGVFKTHPEAPRVLMANSLLVPKWATWDYFWELEQKGLIMFGQMTAGSWIYIGTQGILQGTYETLAAVAEKNFGSSLRGRLVLTAGLGEMGGAQPLAVTMNDGIIIYVEVDKHMIERRLKTGYCETMVESLDDALNLVNEAKKKGTPRSIALWGNAADIYPEMIRKGIIPDVVTDQTAAHDALSGYIPRGLTVKEADKLRKSDPTKYLKMAMDSMADHVKAMVKMQSEGAIVFEYGNNLRQQAYNAGVKEAFSFPGFVQAYIRPLLCEGRGPFRWVALSGNPEDIFKTDEVITREFAYHRGLVKWIKKAHDQVQFQGLPARVCWLGYGERAKFGKIINDMVARGELDAPIVIGRDHMDGGSVASPNRETEGMKDGSDAVADWPILNALLNAVSGATWVAVHHGGGVGIGYSIHAGMVVVADGTKAGEARVVRVLTNDPATSVVRHADAGYKEAIEVAKKKGIRIPMLR